jgi:hypothetical protein
MLIANKMKNADFHTFHHGSKRFCRVYVNIAAGKFFGEVPNGFMGRKTLAGLVKDMMFIGHQFGIGIGKLINDWHNCGVFNFFNVKRNNAPFSLNGYKDASFIMGSRFSCFPALVARFATKIFSSISMVPLNWIIFSPQNCIILRIA